MFLCSFELFNWKFIFLNYKYFSISQISYNAIENKVTKKTLIQL